MSFNNSIIDQLKYFFNYIHQGYAAETWPAKQADVKAVEVFDRWCLRRVVGGGCRSGYRTGS